MKKSIISIVVLGAIVLPTSASALNILVTNDDSWSTHNIQSLYNKLSEAGHSVVMSAPCIGQSGKGGAISLLKEMPVDLSQADDDKYCVGQTDKSLPYEDFVEGTPVMAVMYGLDIVAPAKWQAVPDLVISGPNEGNNVGFVNNSSGTVGAVNFAIGRGIPTIAVSGTHTDTEQVHADMLADIVVNIVSELVLNQKEGGPLLPAFTGLNINTPDDLANHVGYKFTDVGWNPGIVNGKFYEDMSTSTFSMNFVGQNLIDNHPSFADATLEQASAFAATTFANQAGGALTDELLTDDTHPNSEGVAIANNYITISTIDGSLQASKAKVALTKVKLIGLLK